MRNNKRPPTPLICEHCGEDFYGRSDAKTCSTNCRVKLKYKKDKEKNE